MRHKIILFGAFFLIAAAQWYVPTSMILEQEHILSQGTPFKFKTAPIDPSDPFRGKYVVLSFDQSSVTVANKKEWTNGDPIYLTITEDSLGFAKVIGASKHLPANVQHYVRARVGSTWSEDSTEITVDYPFERFYMDEFKAQDAENHYREAQIDSNQVAYALVMIKDGDAALKDLMINGQPIKEILEQKKKTTP